MRTEPAQITKLVNSSFQPYPSASVSISVHPWFNCSSGPLIVEWGTRIAEFSCFNSNGEGWMDRIGNDARNRRGAWLDFFGQQTRPKSKSQQRRNQQGKWNFTPKVRVLHGGPFVIERAVQNASHRPQHVDGADD